MRTRRFILIYLILGAIFFQQVLAEPAPHYQLPGHSVMMRLSVASNGSFALIAVTLSVYGNPPEGMCPIDSPDTYLTCRELSFMEYLLIEAGDGLEYVNLSPFAAPHNFTFVLPVPFGDEWLLEGTDKLPHACHFGVCSNVSRAFMKFSPGDAQIGEPVNSSGISAEILSSIPELLSSAGEAVNGSLVFRFTYLNKTCSLPIEEFSPYLNRLNFSDSNGLSAMKLLESLKAVPLREGLLIYLPAYGLVPYSTEPYMEKGYLIITNDSDPYEPYLWVAHAGFLSVPTNASTVSLTQELFPPLFYYDGSKLTPLLNFSLERYEWSPPGSRMRLIKTRVFLELPREGELTEDGPSPVPNIPLPLEGRVYLSAIQPMPHYSLREATLIDFCLNFGDCIHAELRNGSLTYLQMPFPGIFAYWQGSWLYRSMDQRECFNFCSYGWNPRYNGSYIYNESERILVPLNTSIGGSVPRIPLGSVPSTLPNGISECVPDQKAARMLREVRVGEGSIFYYPVYTTGVSLKGAERAVVWGTYGEGTAGPLNGTCVFFYYQNGSVVFAMRPKVTYVPVAVGSWRLEVALPYIDVNKTVAVSVGHARGRAKKVCGPALFLLLSLIPLMGRGRAPGSKFRKP